MRDRAGDRCDYCHLPQAAVSFAPFHVNHIVAKQHHGKTEDGNLALSCDRCNAYKGPNLTAIDPLTNTLASLFDPRRDIWDEHFEMIGSEIRGLTPIGRATVLLLNMNALRRAASRYAGRLCNSC